MPYEETNHHGYSQEDQTFPMITDRDLLNELKKPVDTPDFAPVVMSRMHRAFPGLMGYAGKSQAWCWRIGTAASILIALGLSMRYGTDYHNTQFANDQELLPTINELVRTFEIQMDDADNTLSAVYGAAGEVASHLPQRAEQSPDSQLVPSSQQAFFQKKKRSIFPVEQSYWSNANHPDLGPTPVAEGNHQKLNKQPISDIDESDSSDENHDQTPPNPMPGSPKFAFSIPLQR